MRRKPKKVLLAGRMDGWMGVYWEQVAQGFRQQGVDCRTFNYRVGKVSWLRRKLLRGDWRPLLRRRRTAALCAALKAFRPDLLITHHDTFEIVALRETFRGRMVYWDMDGPEGASKNHHFPPAEGIDLIVTVSQPIIPQLTTRTKVPVRYLPHGADTQYYAPGAVAEGQRRRFAAGYAFVGRPCKHRLELLEQVADADLAVWGNRWTKRCWRNEKILPCIRERHNVVGKDLVDLYRSTTVFINILRYPFLAPPSIINVQGFAVPSTGTCLLTEWVVELEESFEPDVELLTFRSAEELREQAMRVRRDTALARRIGEAGRRRCEAHHSLAQRAGKILEYVAEL